MSRRLYVVVLVCLVVVVGAWRLHASRVQSPNSESKNVGIAPSLVQETKTPLKAVTSETQNDTRARGSSRTTTDYEQLVKKLSPLATAGSTKEQYELARALYYCSEMLHLYFTNRQTGAVRTLEEAQRIYAKLPDYNIQQQISEAYDRCHSLFSDQSLLETRNGWLDKAANAGYPPALFMKADLMLQANIVTSNTQNIDTARQMALTASASGDPNVLFGMADFVVGTDKTQEQAAQLMSAWWLVGCERGYDCSSQSEWIRANCTSDPQCADGPTVVEELQRMNGAKFGEVQQLANQISAAVDSRDPQEIKKYL